MAVRLKCHFHLDKPPRQDYINRTMTTQIRISAKNLGELAMPNFCPRCFWLKLRLNNKLPFQIFPGIFSSIDSYTKNIVKAYFNANSKFPIWLDGLGELVKYKEPPHYSKFSIVDEDSNVLLWGTPDAIFVKPDDSHVIADYKTAKFTGKQDELMPMYQVQLNAYAVVGEKQGLSPVSDLALIYFEPITDSKATCDSANCKDNGFVMGFGAYLQKVKINVGVVPILLSKVRKIYELNIPPEGRIGCTDCQIIGKLIEVVQI